MDDLRARQSAGPFASSSPLLAEAHSSSMQVEHDDWRTERQTAQHTHSASDQGRMPHTADEHQDNNEDETESGHEETAVQDDPATVSAAVHSDAVLLPKSEASAAVLTASESSADTLDLSAKTQGDDGRRANGARGEERRELAGAGGHAAAAAAAGHQARSADKPEVGALPKKKKASVKANKQQGEQARNSPAEHAAQAVHDGDAGHAALEPLVKLTMVGSSRGAAATAQQARSRGATAGVDVHSDAMPAVLHVSDVWMDTAQLAEIYRWTESSPNREIGGDLFGRWELCSNADCPLTFARSSEPAWSELGQPRRQSAEQRAVHGGHDVQRPRQHQHAYVQYVLRPGPRYEATSVAFYQDTEFLHVQGHALLRAGFEHIGEWHSHHQLRLRRPSGGDERTVYKAMREHHRDHFLLIIATLEQTRNGGLHGVVHPHVFSHQEQCCEYRPLHEIVAPGAAASFQLVDMQPHAQLPRQAHSQQQSAAAAQASPPAVGPRLLVVASYQWYANPAGSGQLKAIIRLLNQLAQPDQVKMFTTGRHKDLELSCTVPGEKRGPRRTLTLHFPRAISAGSS